MSLKKSNSEVREPHITSNPDIYILSISTVAHASFREDEAYLMLGMSRIFAMFVKSKSMSCKE